MHAFDRQTDSNRILIARPRLHCMQRGKNTNIVILNKEYINKCKIKVK